MQQLKDIDDLRQAFSHSAHIRYRQHRRPFMSELWLTCTFAAFLLDIGKTAISKVAMFRLSVRIQDWLVLRLHVPIQKNYCIKSFLELWDFFYLVCTQKALHTGSITKYSVIHVKLSHIYTYKPDHIRMCTTMFTQVTANIAQAHWQQWNITSGALIRSLMKMNESDGRLEE